MRGVSRIFRKLRKLVGRKKPSPAAPDFAAARADLERLANKMAEDLFGLTAGEIVPDDERFKSASKVMFGRIANCASTELAICDLRYADTIVAMPARHAQRIFESRWRELQSAMPRMDSIGKQ